MAVSTDKPPRSKRGSGAPAYTSEWNDWLRMMLLMRRFEEKAGEAYSLGQIGGFCHLYIGQEAVAVGTISALRDDDYIVSAYREHGQALARGMTPRSIMAELFGKATGCSRGKGGSMHLFDASKNFLGGHGIVGGQIPLGAGFAWAAKYRGTDQVSICYFGDAAANIGAFHEALNMAGLWKLPAIFVIENNGYGMGTAVKRAAAITDLAERGAGYGMPGVVVDGQDVDAVRAATDEAVRRARAGEGPTLMDIRCYRYVGHSMSDAPHGTYRTKDEVDAFRQRDPIEVLAARMREAGMLDDDRWAALEAEIAAEVADAVQFAEESPDPDPSELYTDVLAPVEGR
ncbi:MAG TPA: pyruvate dehydrogenase (acetyl-transferring) E1 component subunit alpha [Gemmatimonadales bacterium]|nr:pyruvate dehydrogenase (acetyl-transferring) E1 component subunit alpha [Gemmatimonadales bacterium]